MKARRASIFVVGGIVLLIAVLLFAERGAIRTLLHRGYGTDVGVGVRLPPWMFIWHPAQPIGEDTPPQTAFLEGARGVDPRGYEHPIYDTAWLMVGPTHGEAIVQFAQGDSYLNQAALSVNPSTHDWDGGGGDLPPAQKCVAAVVRISVPGPTCDLGSGQGAEGPFAQWSAPADGKIFLASRLPYSATRPAGATSILLGKTPGWLTQPGLGYTSVVVPLPNGHTFLLASTAGPTRTLAAAQAIMAHLDTFLPEQ